MKYEIWEAHDGPWTPEDAGPPDMLVGATSPENAAKAFAERFASAGEVAMIMRDEHGTYFEIEMIRTWETDMYAPRTLADLAKSYEERR